MKRGICGRCDGPVTFISLVGPRHVNDDGMWVHDHAQMPDGNDVDHDPEDVHDITDS